MKPLLKIPKKAELGLEIVTELARRHAEEGAVSLESIAEKTGGSRKFLEQIAGELRRAGIIEGFRGASGGYRLAKDPASVTLAEFIRALEGPADLSECLAHASPVFARRVRNGVWMTLQAQMMATLMNTKVSDLV